MPLEIQATPLWFESRRTQAFGPVNGVEPPDVDTTLPADSFSSSSSAESRINRAILQRACQPTGPSPAEPVNPWLGLHRGCRGPRVKKLQQRLNSWNPHLKLKASGSFDADTDQAVQLFRSIYTDNPGTGIDESTARILSQMEDGSFWQNPPAKSPGQNILYQASQRLGLPYVMGGDGVHGTDCGMLTACAMNAAGISADSRCADDQYRQAEQQRGLNLVRQPMPGDLVFFDHQTSQSARAYKGVTHVGIYVGNGTMLAASSGRGRVILQPVGSSCGYARAL